MKKRQISVSIIIITVMLLLASVPTLAEAAEVLASKVNLTVSGINTELTLISYDGDLYVPLAAILDILSGTVSQDVAEEIETLVTPSNNVFTLSAGNYIINEDIPSGIYNLTAISGLGYVSSPHNGVLLAETDKIREAREVYDYTVASQTFNNFIIDLRTSERTDKIYNTFYIEGTLTVQFTLIGEPSKPTQ